MQREEIHSIVERVLARVRAGEMPASSEPPANPHGVYKTVSEAVDAARTAQRVLINLPLEKRREIIANIRRRAAEDVHSLARMAHEETGLGRVEDKVKKNLLVIHRTPGPEILQPTAWTGDGGLTLMERAPYGVIGSITPCTNPTETIICNGIGMVSGGNTVVFNTHPAAKSISGYCIDLINRASIEVGGPDNLMCCVAVPTIASATELMKFPGLRLIVVTGGPGVVQAAMNSGKKAICAGPGNPPVVVDETADIDDAGRNIVAGASFDNNVICTDEKEVLVVDKVADRLMDAMTHSGAVRLRNHQITRLERLILTPDGLHVNRDWIGKMPSAMLREIDVPFSGDPRLIICEVPFEHPFVQHELLMPLLAIVTVNDFSEAIRQAKEAEHGFGHTAIMHSQRIDRITEFAKLMQVSLFVANGACGAVLGNGGEGHTALTIAGRTGEGTATPTTFSKRRRMAIVEGALRIV